MVSQVQIPIVDISGSESDSSIANQLVNAATVHGFVYIKNFGEDIAIKDIEDAFDLVPIRYPFLLMNDTVLLTNITSPRIFLHPQLKKSRNTPLQRT